MWKLNRFIYFLIIILLASCSERKKVQEKQIPVQVALIHPLFFQEELSNNLNFPIWFNDSLIATNHIKQLTITSFKGVPQDSSNQNPDNEVAFPKVATVYTFDKAGKLIHIQITNYSEGIIISNQNFQFSLANKYHYAKVLLKENAYGVDNNHMLYVPYKENDDYLAYAGDDDVSMLHFIQSKKFQGPLSVDSIAKPLPTDWVILGSPDRPEKRYKVINKVKENQVSTYTYYEQNYPLVVTNHEFPFFRKRYYNYDNGNFTGFTDSTFIDETFVTNITTNISFDKALPRKIVHTKAHKDGVGNYETFESIDYTFYE